jgi:hypothetical protein
MVVQPSPSTRSRTKPGIRRALIFENICVSPSRVRANHARLLCDFQGRRRTDLLQSLQFLPQCESGHPLLRSRLSAGGEAGLGSGGDSHQPFTPSARTLRARRGRNSFHVTQSVFFLVSSAALLRQWRQPEMIAITPSSAEPSPRVAIDYWNLIHIGTHSTLRTRLSSISAAAPLRLQCQCEDDRPITHRRWEFPSRTLTENLLLVIFFRNRSRCDGLRQRDECRCRVRHFLKLNLMELEYVRSLSTSR